jgi:sec-independent protein translocase protein TatB
MFDIGFWEICLVGVVALLVLGPEDLPRAARTVGLWLNKARREVTRMKSEIERELEVEDLRRAGLEMHQTIHANVERIVKPGPSAEANPGEDPAGTQPSTHRPTPPA